MGTQTMGLSDAIFHGEIPPQADAAICPTKTFSIGVVFRFSTKDVMDEFIGLLKANPKVWAVAANGDPGGIDVWTYIDSDEQRDREAVYEVEWELMKRYPDVAFDFSTILSPAGSEFLEHGHYTYLYRR